MNENEVDIVLERLENLAKEYFKYKYTKSEEEAIKSIISELNSFKRDIINIKKKSEQTSVDSLMLEKIKETIDFGEANCKKLAEVKTKK